MSEKLFEALNAMTEKEFEALIASTPITPKTKKPKPATKRGHGLRKVNRSAEKRQWIADWVEA